jgi:hypothetical protein
MSRIRHPKKLEPRAYLAGALILTALVSGCGGSSSTDGSAAAVEATEPVETRRKVHPGETEALLEPTEGSSAQGTARYQIKPHSTPVLHIEAAGLEPVSGKSRYAIWIVGDRHDMVILAGFQVGEDGRLSRQLEGVESYVFVEEGSKTELLVTKVDDINQISKGIAESGDPWDPPLIGEPVLQGTFEGPFVGPAGGQ